MPASIIVEGETGVDDVFDQEQVTALDRIVDVARDANAFARLRAGVAPEVEIVDDEWDLDLARQVGHEEGDALEHSDQDDRTPAVVTRDLCRERAHARLELHRGDDDVADVLLAQVLHLDSAVARLGEELLVVLSVQQPDVDIGIQLAQEADLAILRGDQGLLHRRELDVHVVLRQVEVRREHLCDALAFPGDRE